MHVAEERTKSGKPVIPSRIAAMPVFLDPVKKVDDNVLSYAIKEQLLYFNVFPFFHESYELNKSILVSQDGIWAVIALARKILGQESAEIFCKISRFHGMPDYWISGKLRTDTFFVF